MQEKAHHGLPAHEVVLLLEADPFEGLDPDQVPGRRELYGRNVLPRSTRGGLVRKVSRQFNNPLIYVLLAAAGVTTYLGEHLDTFVILAVVLVNTVIGLVQEVRAEAALDALRHLVQSRVQG